MMPKPLLMMLFFLGFLVQGDNTVISPILPDIADALVVSIPVAATAVAGYLIPFGVFALIHGPLADRFGQTKIINVAALCIGSYFVYWIGFLCYPPVKR